MTDTPTTPEAVRAALDAATPEVIGFASRIVAMSLTESGRLRMTTSEFLSIGRAQPILATAYLAQADEIARLRRRVEAADRLTESLGHFLDNVKGDKFLRAHLDTYRATEEGK